MPAQHRVRYTRTRGWLQVHGGGNTRSTRIQHWEPQQGRRTRPQRLATVLAPDTTRCRVSRAAGVLSLRSRHLPHRSTEFGPTFSSRFQQPAASLALSLLRRYFHSSSSFKASHFSFFFVSRPHKKYVHPSCIGLKNM